MCKKILMSTIKEQQAQDVTCPIKLSPACHPDAGIDVHIDGIGGIIYLSCRQCDRMIETIKVKPYAKLDSDPTP